MLTLTVHDPESGVRRVEDLFTISDLISKPDTMLWLDAVDPSPDEISLLASEFGFHPLAIETYYSPHPRPKLDEYPGYFFLAAHTVVYDEHNVGVKILELDLFVGKDYIVTLHKEQIPFLETVTKRWLENSQLFAEGTGMLLYDILDSLVDSYFPVLDEMNYRLDEIEDQIFEKGAETPITDIFHLKRGLVLIRQVAAPLRDTLNSLIRREQPLLSQKDLTYLRDVYDHTLRIVDVLDTYRDILTSALDAYLTVISNQQNIVMKQLTVAATVLMTSGLVTGIYGMNFAFMPELHWRLGYPYALGLMAVLAGALLYYFKRVNWL